MFLWRISNYVNLDGRGGLLASARWHTEGRRVVYLAETPAGALLEHLVHLELNPARLPKSYRLLKAEVPDRVQLATLTPDDLSENWATDHVATRTLGDEWLASRATALLRVPSAVLPETFNVLLNPDHADAASVAVQWHTEFPWDTRLLSR